MLCCNAMDGRNALAASQRPLLELPTRSHAWITRIYQMKNEQQKTARECIINCVSKTPAV